MLWNKEFYKQDYISFLYQWNVQSDSLYATHILKISNKYTNSNKSNNMLVWYYSAWICVKIVFHKNEKKKFEKS